MPLKISDVSTRFTTLLEAEGTSRESPELAATWRAFTKFCSEMIDCDDEGLFFEADLSSSQPDCFYVHFSRTCYGRQPAGHVWSHEVICDFVYPLDGTLESFNVCVEIEEITGESDERDHFLSEVQSHTGLWKALAAMQPKETSIYIGES
jgi:hypothetical protein